MIQRLRLQNFQSHVDNEFNFKPGLNIIVGPSGSGKSSILRALKYLFTNSAPSGVNFTRRGPDKPKSFKLEADVDGHIIKREKSKTVNTLELKKLGETKSLDWEDFGVNLPTAISDATNIKPIVFSDDTEFSVQLQTQYDPHFLVTDSDSVKAKFFTRISGAHIVDLALKNVLTDSTTAQRTLETESVNMMQTKEKLDKLQTNYQLTSQVLDKIKQRTNELVETSNRVQALKALQAEYSKVQKMHNAVIRKEIILGQVNTDAWEKKIASYIALKDLQTQYNYLKNRLNFAVTAHQRAEAIPIAQLEAKVRRIEDLTALRGLYKPVSASLDIITRQIDGICAKITATAKDFEEQLMKEGNCPQCGTKITETLLKKIAQELN